LQDRLLRCFSLLMYLALTVGAIWLAVRFLLPWAAPFLLAFALASMLEYPVRALVRRRIRRGAAAGIMTLALLALLIWGTAEITSRCISAVSGFAERLPELMTALGETLEKLESRFMRYAETAPEGVDEYMRAALGTVGELAYSLPARISAWAVNSLAAAAGRSPDLILFAVTAGIGTYFISAGYPRISSFIQAQLPAGLMEKLEGLGQDLKISFGGFVKAQLILMAIIFFVLLALFLVIEAENAVLMAAITAFVDALPVFGAGIVLVPWALYSALLGAYGRAAVLLGAWLGVNLLRSCLQAKLLGDQIGLEPLPSLIAIYVGWRVWSVWGMLLFPILLVTLQQLNDKGVLKLWKSI